MNWACRCILRYIVYQQKRETPSSSCVGDREKSPVSTVNNIYMQLSNLYSLSFRWNYSGLLSSWLYFWRFYHKAYMKRAGIFDNCLFSFLFCNFRIQIPICFCRSLLDLPHTSFPELFQSTDFLRWTKKCTFKIVVWFIIAVSSLEERISYRDLLFLTLEFVDFKILSMQDLQMNQAKQTNVKWLKSDHRFGYKKLNCALNLLQSCVFTL